MRFIIITGSGRSGTTFLANLLNHAQDVEARHQFFGGRTAMNAAFSRDTLRTISYYQPNHPMLEMTLRQQAERAVAEFPKLQAFVDVNPFLSYALDTVRRTLDDVLCFQLVRNGREVVRSQYNSKKYIARGWGLPVVPSDPTTMERWGAYSRFEKVCWLWNETVSRLLEQGVRSINLESIISDYRYLRSHLLEPSGINLDADVWHDLKKVRLHGSAFRLKRLVRGRPVKLTWTPKHEAQFMAICGETMRTLGCE